MSCSGITLIQDDKPVNLGISESITLIQQIEEIQVCAQNPVTQFIPYYFVATAGQSVFILPAIALSIPLCAFNGIAQSQAKTPTPDFTVNETILTMAWGLDEGDLVFGVIQIA